MVRNMCTDVLLFFSLSPTGFLGVLVTKIITHYMDKAFPYVIKFININSIKFENAIHQHAFETSQYRLKIIGMESGVDSEKFKKERELEKNKLYDLLIFNDGPIKMRVD